MTEIVPANRGEACTRRERLEVTVDQVMGVYGCPDGGGEDEAVLGPLSTNPKPLHGI